MFFVLQAASGVSEAYNWIEQLFAKLDEFTDRLGEYLEGDVRSKLENKIVSIFACILEILARAEQAIKDGRFKKYAALLFLGRDEETKAAFDQLSLLFEEEARLVGAINLATTQNVAQKVEVIDSKIDKVHRELVGK